MIDYKKIIAISTCVTSITMLVACNKDENEIDKIETKPTEYKTELLSIVDIDNQNKYENVVKSFDFGEVKLNENNGVNVPIKGIVGSPKDIQDAPIIFIISGNNSYSDDLEAKDSYLGFKYLVDKLSKNGFLTIAIDSELPSNVEQEEYVEDKILNLVFEEHLIKLRDAINGKNNDYPISLYKKGDLNSIGLIGQNNTGRTIFNISNKILSNNENCIKGLLSITPSIGTSVSAYPDIPTSILSTEHSLDTTIAFDIYSDIEKNQERKSLVGLTYLIGGDSDKFNDLVKEGTLYQDNKDVAITKSSISVNEDTIKDEFSHEEFLSLYALDFFEYVFGDNIKDSIYDINSPTPQKLYQKDVLSKLHTNNKKLLFDYRNLSSVNLEGIKLRQVVESSVPTLDTAINFNDPSTNIELNLVELEWKSVNSKFTLPLESNNIADYKALSIEWALNHFNELNSSDLTNVDVCLKDTFGNTSTVKLLDDTSTRFISGEAEIVVADEKTAYNWSRFTPISESRIPLRYFEGVDLANIESISINLGDNECGSIYMKNIHLKK